MHGCIYNRQLFLHGTRVFFNKLPFTAYRVSHISGYHIVHFYKNVHNVCELKNTLSGFQKIFKQINCRSL